MKYYFSSFGSQPLDLKKSEFKKYFRAKVNNI